MWELDHKESWEPKTWWFWTVVLEETLESPLDCKEIKLVNPKGNQSWICIGKTDAEAKAPILWPPDAKNWLTGKDPDAEKDRRQEEKETTEDEIVGWHYGLDGHEFEHAPGVGWWTGKPGILHPWSHTEIRHDWVTELNWMLLWIYIWNIGINCQEKGSFPLYTYCLFLDLLSTYSILSIT